VKRFLISVLLLFPALMIGQTDNTVYVKNFPGSTVGQKVTAAQNSCNPAMTCVVIFDPSLANWTSGTFPAKCSTCMWEDYRSPTGGQQLAGGAVGTYGYLPSHGVDPRAFGAVGNGTTDDTSAIQTAWNYAMANNLPLYIPTPSNCFKITAPVNFGATGNSMVVFGDLRQPFGGGRPTSELCYVNFATANESVIDASSNGYANLTIDGISILPLSGTLSGSNIGSCIFAEATTGGGGSLQVKNNNLQCGGGSGTNAIQTTGFDDSSISDNNINSLGNGIVAGQLAGPGLTTSTFYTAGSGQGVTHIVIAGNVITSVYSPIEATGNTGSYTISDNDATHYIAMVGAGNNSHGIIDFSYATGNSTVFMYGIRTENQSSATGVCAINMGGGLLSGIIEASLYSDNAGPVFCGNGGTTSILANLSGFIQIANTSSIFSNIQVNNSYLTLASGGNATLGTPIYVAGSRIALRTSASLSSMISGILANGTYGVFSNGELCTLSGSWEATCERFAGTSSQALRVEGRLDLGDYGGHLFLADQGECTMSSGSCGIIYLTANQSNISCFANWTGTGTLTGILKVAPPSGDAGTYIIISSSVGTDTAQVVWGCFGK
jgi:hypothetical protein